MASEPSHPISFRDLELPAPLLEALSSVGYEAPSPIQARTIPTLLLGKDVLGQAQTGTGKTAAFALPLLARIDLARLEPQVLVLAPTRELAIQVAEAFQRYAAKLRGFHVLPIYGGQDYVTQLRQLKRGPQVVVGTPGRVMDHMRRGTLKLQGLSTLVLDEADEMLRMGFIEDVEWILTHLPSERQVVLFSATMPSAIQKIAGRHLSNPEIITTEVHRGAAETIRQHYWMVSGLHKLDALTRMLEVQSFDGMLIFVRTKTATVELAEKLEARGYTSAPLNGDIPQRMRERTVDGFKAGRVDILVATDVAARGLDVDRISHVVNFDIPYDTESYIHRIGRTGRAGRTGEAILFVAPRERRMLNAIERATGQKIVAMELPSTQDINDKRVARFKERITNALAMEELEPFHQLVEQYQQEHNIPALEIAAALARMIQGEEPLLLPDLPPPRRPEDKRRGPAEHSRASRRRDSAGAPGRGMERFRIEVGRRSEVKPGNIVGAIANEVGLERQHIGRIDIHDEYATVDLPRGMPPEILHVLKSVYVAGQAMRISRLAPNKGVGGKPRKKPAKSGSAHKDGKHKRKKGAKARCDG